MLDSLKIAFDEVKDDALKGLRAKAWDHFLELGLPEKKQEAFQYVPLRELYNNAFMTSKQTALELSTCQVLTLPEAMKSYGHFLQNRFGKTLKEETDPFAALNLAIHPCGVFVYIPPKTKITIECLHAVAAENSIIAPRLQIFVGSQSEVNWICKQQVTGKNNFTTSVVDVALEDGASFNVVNHLDTSGWHFEAWRATLKRDSHFGAVSSTQGSACARLDYRVALTQENGSVDLDGIWMLEGKNQAHTHILIEHAAPYCRSHQHFKGVLADISQSSFEGKILVRDVAQKTEAYQLNNNLILGDFAIAHSKPNLEIFADDVKASHGATVSQVDPEQQFYLNSRGLSSEEAKKLLVRGFCLEILDKMKEVPIR